MKIKAETTNGGLIGIYVISNPRRVELVRDNAILDTQTVASVNDPFDVTIQGSRRLTCSLTGHSYSLYFELLKGGVVYTSGAVGLYNLPPVISSYYLRITFLQDKSEDNFDIRVYSNGSGLLSYGASLV